VLKFLKKPDIGLLCDPTTPLIGIQPKEMKWACPRDKHTSMFIILLFIITKTLNQPRCLPVDEWIEKMRYVYSVEYYS
jgi:hypothetical protein